MKKHLAYLGLGSNRGDRSFYLTKTLQLFSEKSEIEVIKHSKIIETLPLGETEQGKFLNQVILIKTSFNPFQLLLFCKEMEELIGRVASFHWGPREIDIDILIFNSEVVETPFLTIPHRELLNRPFLSQLINQLNPLVFHGKNKRFL